MILLIEASLYGLLLFFVSCGSTELIGKDKSVEKSVSVDLNLKNITTKPKILSNKSDSLGPISDSDFDNLTHQDLKKRLEPIALVLGPGLYRTIAHIPLLTELDRIGRTPNLVLGHGLAAIVAAYYSLGYTPAFIEWKFFKLFKDLSKEEVFEDSWYESISKILLKELKSKRIEDGKLTLVIPVWNEKTRKVIYLKRGDLVSALIGNLNYAGRLDTKYQPAFTHEILDKKILKKMGINKLILADLLLSGISWRQGSGLLTGLYKKAAYRISQLEMSKNEIIEFDLKEFKMDDIGEVANIVYESKRQSSLNLDFLKRRN